MGFGCNDFETIDYPTTLNRLILNYLYVAKYGQALHVYADGRNDIPTDDRVSLIDLVDLFEKVRFITINKKLNVEQIKAEYNTARNKGKSA